MMDILRNKQFYVINYLELTLLFENHFNSTTL